MLEVVCVFALGARVGGWVGGWCEKGEWLGYDEAGQGWDSMVLTGEPGGAGRCVGGAGAGGNP